MSLIKQIINDCAIVTGPVKNDSHLSAIYDHLKEKIESSGHKILKKKVHSLDGIHAKNYDLVYQAEGINAIELKSINSNPGKNMNNRIEEMIGQAYRSSRFLPVKKFDYIFILNCETTSTHKKRLFQTATKLVDDGLLHRFAIFDTTCGTFYKTGSFEEWNF